MVANYNALAFSSIRSLLWKELKDAGILDETDYWSETMGTYLIPIIPSQEVPEFQNVLPGVPFIVYDWQISGYDSNFWICEETASLTIIANDYATSIAMIELIKDVFRRYDITARLINYNSNSATFKFLQCYIESIVSPEFGEDEGGSVFSVVNINYSYTRRIDNSYRYSS
jgi:hypothetical protein